MNDTIRKRIKEELLKKSKEELVEEILQLEEIEMSDRQLANESKSIILDIIDLNKKLKYYTEKKPLTV